MSTYLQVLIYSLSIPLLFTFHDKIKFHKQWLAFFKANIITAIPFIIWDIIFTKKGIWGFNEKHISEISIYNLPLEEVLFFIIIPYCCVFTYYTLKKILSIDINTNRIKILTLILALCVLIVASIYHYYLYTFITLIILGLLLILITLKEKNLYILKNFYITYIIISLIPFIIVNGILTGGPLNEPVVWYNINEMINIRVWSIPITDFFYSMLLLLINCLLFEIFSRPKPAN